MTNTSRLTKPLGLPTEPFYRLFRILLLARRFLLRCKLRTSYLAPGLLAACAVIASTSGSMDWKPIDPADLAQTAPKVEKDADAEAIFWEVWVSDGIRGDLPNTVLAAA